MMRLIDADTLQFVPKGTKYVVGVRGNGKALLNLMAAVQEAIDKTPTIDAEPVIHGWWIPFADHMWACSNCRVMGSPQWKRCPVCEAKMDGGAEDD